MHCAFLQAEILRDPMQLLSQSIWCRSVLCIHLGRLDLPFPVHLYEGLIITLNYITGLSCTKKRKRVFWGVSNDASVIPQSPRKDYINI